MRGRTGAEDTAGGGFGRDGRDAVDYAGWVICWCSHILAFQVHLPLSCRGFRGCGFLWCIHACFISILLFQCIDLLLRVGGLLMPPPHSRHVSISVFRFSCTALSNTCFCFVFLACSIFRTQRCRWMSVGKGPQRARGQVDRRGWIRI